MREFILVQIEWESNDRDHPTADGPRHKTGYRPLWQGEALEPPTLESLIAAGMPQPEEPRCGCCALQQHLAFTYLVQELVDGEWQPPVFTEEDFAIIDELNRLIDAKLQRQ